MSTVTHNLGELEHIFAKRHLKLITNADVTLSSSDASHFPFSDVFEYLEELLTARTWIGSGNSFMLRLSLYFDGIDVEGGAISDHAEKLGLVLQNAEMWRQLLLTPSLEIPQILQDCPRPSVELRLTLTPSHDIDPARKQDTSPYNLRQVKPPAGVSCAIIESINLSLQIRQCPTRKTSRLKRKRGEITGRTRNDKDPKPHGAIDESLSTGSLSHFDLDLSPQVTQIEPERASILRDGSEGNATFNASVSPVLETRINSQSSASSQASLTVMTRQMDVVTQMLPRLITPAELTRLVDCSLRAMICTPKQAMPAGLLLSSMTDDPKLGHISPAIFSPGYLKAISQRMPLLPILAQTIAGIGCRAQSASLCRKMPRLGHISFHRYSPDCTMTNVDTESNGPSLLDVAEVRFWFLLQQNLYDEEACSRLKPLKMSNSKRTDAADLGNLLDDGTSRADENMVRVPHLSQDADEERTQLDQMLRAKAECFEAQDPAHNLLHEESLLGEECFDSLDDTFLEHQKEPNAFDSGLDDEAYELLGEDGADDDLFWSGLDDDDDLLANKQNVSRVSYELLGAGRNGDELLDGIPKEAYQHQDLSEDLEDPWPEDADILFEERVLLWAN